MATNKIQSLLGDTPNPVTTSVDYWSSHDIDLAYVIVITGRCGSTLLTHLVSSLSLFGKPDELFTEEMLPHMIRKYRSSEISCLLSNIAKDASSNRTFGFQIDPLRLSWLQSHWDICDDIRRSSIRFGAMIRQDLLSQAYSYLSSKRSGIWHTFSSQNSNIKESIDSSLSVSDSSVLAVLAKELLIELTLILRSEDMINMVARESNTKPVIISYEELITDRFHTIYKLMRGLGASYAVTSSLDAKRDLLQAEPTLKSSYTYKEIIFDYLYENYRDIVVSLNTDRTALCQEIAMVIASM